MQYPLGAVIKLDEMMLSACNIVFVYCSAHMLVVLRMARNGRPLSVVRRRAPDVNAPGGAA